MPSLLGHVVIVALERVLTVLDVEHVVQPALRQ